MDQASFLVKDLYYAGMLSLPLMSTLALHPSQPLKAWAGHLLTALRPAPHPGISPASIPKRALPSDEGLFSPVAFHGLPCLLQQASNLLTNMWAWDATANDGKKTNGDTSAGSNFPPEQIRTSPLTWLGQFRAALHSAKTADSQKSEDSERILNSQQDEVMRMILTALLDHLQLEVQAAAAAACGEAVQAFPLCGISFFPLLIYKLQSSVAQTQHGMFVSSEDLMCIIALLHVQMHSEVLCAKYFGACSSFSNRRAELLLCFGLYSGHLVTCYVDKLCSPFVWCAVR